MDMTHLMTVVNASVLIEYGTKYFDCDLAYINQQGKLLPVKFNDRMHSFKETFFARDGTIGFRFTNRVEECQPLLEERV
jgi:hypothetical protein